MSFNVESLNNLWHRSTTFDSDHNQCDCSQWKNIIILDGFTESKSDILKTKCHLFFKTKHRSHRSSIRSAMKLTNILSQPLILSIIHYLPRTHWQISHCFFRPFFRLFLDKKYLWNNRFGMSISVTIDSNSFVIWMVFRWNVDNWIW